MITKKLFDLQNTAYREFHSKLMPTVDKSNVIGIPVPLLRNLAKKLYGTAEAEEFIAVLPHHYYEENNLHAFLIAQIDDYEICVEAVNRFLPFIDNWATCDSLRPKAFNKNKEKLEVQIFDWLKSGDLYTVRFAIEMLMVHFLDDDFKTEYPEKISKIKTDEYYLEMMIAWYFATALAKQYKAVIPYLEQRRLSPSIHAKTIRKAIESHRISDDEKEYLKTLK